jgi:hypothetical protein
MRRASSVKLTLRSRAALAPFFCLALSCFLPAVHAGEARVVEGNSPDRVIVEASDATADEVLAALAAYFQIVVERSGQPSQPVRLSGRLQGTLDQLLDRLLRHEGHMIVRSAEARAGISQIRLFDAKGGVPPPGVADAVAAIKARLQLRGPAQDGVQLGK